MSKIKMAAVCVVPECKLERVHSKLALLHVGLFSERTLAKLATLKTSQCVSRNYFHLYCYKSSQHQKILKIEVIDLNEVLIT